ncbi:uncharacterized protein [Nothobranchius furzeri]|uniref:uncharacterized protein n=1 Tax=Nothobranchius furzeri TaxID=105023 RepID=UPI002403A755|nr:uncharacterized protein zgc:194621 [Nothobranchius furzeri]
MPSAILLKPKPVEAVKNPVEKPKPVPGKASKRTEPEPRGSALRKSCAPSCRQRVQDRRDPTDPRGSSSKPNCSQRIRSSSTAPKPTEDGSRTSRTPRRASSCTRQAAADPKPLDPIGCSGQREQRGARTEPKVPVQNNKAFTVIPPNPKKRREIQKKAEAELAALEELRLSRAMSYVSINPSSVGGCLSLEEVRLKQQQEMMQAKRKPKLLEAGGGGDTCPDTMTSRQLLVMTGS